MNLRQTSLALWTAATAFAGAAVAALILGLLLPVQFSSEHDARSDRRTAVSSRTSNDAIPLDAFESIWALDLRKPLTESASATTATASTAATDAGPFVLVGTIGDSLAMIRTASGAVEVKAVGEQVNGVKILAIRPSQIDVEIAGQRKTFIRPREPGGG
ncbi:MAG TPA: hypothetical protein VH475_04250 [Tepidisphaeraceae bacterium]|jgi:hypothetical protein